MTDPLDEGAIPSTSIFFKKGLYLFFCKSIRFFYKKIGVTLFFRAVGGPVSDLSCGPAVKVFSGLQDLQEIPITKEGK